ARRTRVLGPSHVDVALTMGHLAAALRQAGELEEARALLERSLALQRDAYGGDHPLVASTMANLAQVLSLRDDHAEAARHFREAIAVRERLDGRAAVPPALLEALALELERLGTASEAESLRREALAAISARAGADSPQAAGARFRLGGFLRRSGQPAEATAELRTALGLFETAAAPDAAWVRETRAELALAYADANAWADAATLHAQLEAEALPDADTLADVLDALGRRIRAAR
ncbi:MAG: tetratricopeptide repeat protein, partial [Gemmatimonadetes bacterium]|nr:tetratricopeptide repeat protein [Gemmatimonadota bacterium]